MRTRLFQRLGLVLAGALAASAAVLTLAAPAQAAPAASDAPSGQSARSGLASICYFYTELEKVPGQYIWVSKYRDCGPPNPPVGSPVTISRRHFVTGTYSVVASGVGSAVYHCNGSAVNTYKTSISSTPFTLACG